MAICGSQIGMSVQSLLRTNHGMPGRHGAHCGYHGGSLRVEELDGLLTHAAACATCRDKLRETWRQLGRIPPAEFDAVLAGYKDGLAAVRETFARLRCATCHLSGQSCSWICRRRFIADRAV